MYVIFQGSVNAHCVGLGEELFFAVCIHKTNKYLVARFDSDLTISVPNGRLYRRFAIGAEGTVETDSFHGIVEYLVIRFGRIQFGEAINFWKMNLSFL